MRGQFDRIDMALASLFTLAAAASVGIADVTLFGTAISDTAFTVGGETMPFSSAIALAVLGVAFWTNDADLDSLDDEYTYAVIATFALTVLIPVVPSLNSAITGNDWLALAAVIIQSAGYAGVSYFA